MTETTKTTDSKTKETNTTGNGTNKFLRKALLLGLGGFTYAKEAVEGFVKDLEKEGQISPEEGKKMVDEVMQEGKKFADARYEDTKKLVQKVIDDMGLVTKKDLENIKKD